MVKISSHVATQDVHYLHSAVRCTENSLHIRVDKTQRERNVLDIVRWQGT